jgi:hypothetical protein
MRPIWRPRRQFLAQPQGPSAMKFTYIADADITTCPDILDSTFLCGRPLWQAFVSARENFTLYFTLPEHLQLLLLFHARTKACADSTEACLQLCTTLRSQAGLKLLACS